MMAKITEGKWAITTDGEANFYGIATEKDWLLRIQQNGSLSNQEQKAIICLIAAAPKLLEACKAAQAELSIQLDDLTDPCRCDDKVGFVCERCAITSALKTVKQAIAAAEGGGK